MGVPTLGPSSASGTMSSLALTRRACGCLFFFALFLGRAFRFAGQALQAGLIEVANEGNNRNGNNSQEDPQSRVRFFENRYWIDNFL